jgi:hypothetical protein
MKHYNIFYKNKKVNNKPISDEKIKIMLDNAKNNMVALEYKSNIVNVPLSDIRIIKCVIV